jgi:hypothetical protein
VSHSNCCWSTKLRTTRAQMMKDATGTPNCSLPDQPECNEVLIYRQQQCGFQHERRDYRKNPRGVSSGVLSVLHLTLSSARRWCSGGKGDQAVSANSAVIIARRGAESKPATLT